MTDAQVAEFEKRNPYVKSASRGSLFVPPEAEGEGFHDLNQEKANAALQKQKTQEALVSEVAMPKTEKVPTGLQSLDAFLTEAAEINDAPDHHVNEYTVVWHVTVVPDDWNDPKHCTPEGDLKPRRPVPHCRVSQLLGGVKFQKDAWIHEGQINHWPSTEGLMLAAIKLDGEPVWKAREKKPLPTATDIAKGGTATFLGPKWSEKGWLPDSPGFVFWFSEMYDSKPRILCGERMIHTLQEADTATRDAHVTNVHYYCHRYPVEKHLETERDRNEWHTLVLLEWEHKRWVTVVESAWCWGVGGYGCKSNWCEDKMTPDPVLSTVVPPAWVRPWDNSKSEYRVWDLPFGELSGFEGYLTKYSETGGLPQKEQRFLQWKSHATGPRKVKNMKAEDIAAYVLNYAGRTPSYNVPYSNCMTFATDFYSFCTGSRDAAPAHPGLRPYYTQKVLSFLYMASA